MDKKNSLLIVDDDAASLMELASILKQDYKIFAVKDGRPAIDKAHEALPDLILLDVVMPGMNGFDVLAELKKSEMTKNIPVIFITGVNETEGESEGLALGAVDYIRKPYDAMVVLHRIRIQIQIINLQRDLENAAEDAKAANQSKSAFLANMSHEIRTPMNAIMGITDILLHNDNKSPVEVADGLERIYASSEMLLNIINDILDFSKIEAGKLDILPSLYRIENMINDTIQLNIMRVGEKPINFVLDIDEGIPAKFVGDELRIKQILNNLLSNAFKYTPAGTVTLSVSHEKDPATGSVTLIFVVKDTGSGMTKEQLEMLFEEYSRFNEDTNRSIEGTGLGLSIMRFLVNLMNGSVFVESEHGEGTSVTIKLPQGTVDKEVLGKEAAEDLRNLRQINRQTRESSKIKREPMPYGSVLVVDDTDTNLFVAVRFMEPYKLRVETASNGREAIDIIEGGKEYDIIFMDHMMPEMDGMEVTKYLRDSGYKHPIVALTANALAGQAEVFLNNGFDEFVSKPIDIHQLDSILMRFIRDKQPQDVIDEAHRQAREEAAAESSRDKSIIRPEQDPMLIESFLDDAYKALAIFDELYQKPGWLESDSYIQRYITTIHNLKGVLGCINEKTLSDMAQTLEVSGRNNDTAAIDSETPGFIEKLRELISRLEQDYGSRADVSDDDIVDLCEKLHTINEFCMEYDRKGVLDLITGIKEFSQNTSDVLGNIKELVLHSEFEEAGRTAVRYALEVADSGQKRRASGTIPLSSREISGLDIAGGIARFEGSEEAYLKALRSYATGTRVTLDEIRTVTDESLAFYKISVHGIKGASYDICALHVGKLADDLENAADAGVIGFITAHNPAFLDAAGKLIDDIEILVASIAAENPKPKKDKPDEVILAKLARACDNYSMDEVDAAMTELESFEYEDDDGLVENIRKCVDLMQFNQIVKMLTE